MTMYSATAITAIPMLLGPVPNISITKIPTLPRVSRRGGSIPGKARTSDLNDYVFRDLYNGDPDAFGTGPEHLHHKDTDPAESEQKGGVDTWESAYIRSE